MFIQQQIFTVPLGLLRVIFGSSRVLWGSTWVFGVSPALVVIGYYSRSVFLGSLGIFYENLKSYVKLEILEEDS